MSPEDPSNGNGAFELPLFTPRRVVQTVLVVLILLVGIYFLFPKLAGLGDSLSKLGDADAVWIAVAIGFNVIAIATYIALFKAVVGGDALRLTWGETYEINMAGVAATLLFSAGGAGGIALTYWALRKAGMAAPRRRPADGRLPRPALRLLPDRADRLRGPAADRRAARRALGRADRHPRLGGRACCWSAAPWSALIPADLSRRVTRLAHGERAQAIAAGVAKVPATVAEGLRFTLGLFANPSRGGLAVIGAIGFWAANIGILWASFQAFGVEVPIAVVVQGFFLGMVANLIPLAPAGVGAVDAGMIGAFVLFGIPEETVFPAILIYRLVAFWLPIPPGIVAFFQLRKRVARWEEEGLPIDRGGTIQSEVLDSPQPSGPISHAIRWDLGPSA